MEVEIILSEISSEIQILHMLTQANMSSCILKVIYKIMYHRSEALWERNGTSWEEEGRTKGVATRQEYKVLK